jgi:hypothetical protein
VLSKRTIALYATIDNPTMRLLIVAAALGWCAPQLALALPFTGPGPGKYLKAGIGLLPEKGNICAG